jgi:hypothetical protein
MGVTPYVDGHHKGWSKRKAYKLEEVYIVEARGS